MTVPFNAAARLMFRCKHVRSKHQF